MQFLLLLSALVSVVTGAFGVARPAAPHAGQAESQLVAAIAPAQRPAPVAAAPVLAAKRAPERAIAFPLPPELRVARAAPLDPVRLNE